MKLLLRVALTALLGLGLSGAASAQISGTVFIPSLAYPTLDSAFKALNAQGIGAGGLTINMTVDETAPAGGYRLGSAVLNASLSATKTLTINGANKQITAAVGTGTTDGVFLLSGTDYVTFDGLKIMAAGGTTDVQKTEWGFALLKLNATAPYDGCQNVTIRNCTINLGAALQSTGVYLSHALATAAGTILPNTGADSTDANSNVVITRDSLLGAERGVYAIGIGAAGAWDYNNRIGGANATDGNVIILVPTTSNIANGVYAAYDSVLTVRHNNFQNAAAQTGSFNQVELGNSRGGITIRNNRFDLSNTGTINTVAAFYNPAPGALRTNGFNDTTATFNFSDNTIIGSNPNALAGSVYGFRSVGLNARTAVIRNNVVKDIAWGAATYNGSLFCLNYTAGTADSLNVSDNALTNITKNGAGASGVYTSVFRNAGGMGTKGFVYEYNTIKSVVAENLVWGHYVEARTSLNQVVKSRYNVLDSVVISRLSGTGNLLSYLSTNGLNPEVSYNTFRRVLGISGVNVNLYWAQNDQNPAVHHNTTDSVSTGNGNLFFSVNATTNGGAFYENTVRNLTNVSGLLYGINIAPAAGTVPLNVYNNLFSNFSKTNPNGFSNGRLRGIFCSGSGTVNLYNNTVSNLFVNADYAGSATDLVGIYLGGSGSYNLYHNTVRITATGSATEFSATGVYYEAGAANVLLRNNIINVNSTPAGNGTVVALRRSSGTAGTPPANLNDTTNNNIYFAPNVPNAFFYAEGGGASSVVDTFSLAQDPAVNGSCPSAYKTFMAPREKSSFVENNLVAVGTLGLYAPTGASYAKRNAPRLSGLPLITSAQNGTARPPAADDGALQFTGTPLDGTAPVITYVSTPASFCNSNQRIVTTIKDTSGVRRGTGTLPRLYYIKNTSINTFAVPNTAAGNGWKWVEPVAIVGDTFSFTPDYSKLQGGAVAGDVISYFVIAQDSAVTPNVAYKTTAFPATFCPASVSLDAAPPVTTAPPNTVLLNFINKTVTPQGPTTFCASSVALGSTTAVPNTVTLKVTTSPNVTYQWKKGTAAITGATTDSLLVTTAGSYSVVLTNTLTGCKDSSTVTTVTINPNPLARITPFPTASACAGDSVRLATNKAAGLTYNWYRNDVLLTANNTTDSFYFASVSGSYRVRVSSGALCSAITDTPTVVTINTFPLPAATITAVGSTSICDGDSVTLRANGGGNFMYQWRLNGNNIALGGTDSFYRAKVAGAYTVRITTVNGCSRTSAATTVTVNPIPTATITPAGSSAFCAGSSFILSANTGTGFSYQWKKDGVNVPSGGTGATYSATTAGSYTVQVTTSAGCTKLSAATVLTVNPLPVVTVTSSATAVQCQGTTVTLTGNSLANHTYQWLLNGGAIAGATNISYAVTNAGSYSLRATNTTTGCIGTSAATSVTFNALPVVTIASNKPSPICSEDSIRLRVLNYTNTVAYQWRLNGAPIAGATDTAFTVVNNSGSYTLSATNTNGCTGTSAPINIVVNPTPFTTITFNTLLTFCRGGEVALTAQTIPSGKVSWYGNGVQIVPIDTNRVRNVANTGTYYVVSITPAGCTATSNSVVVTVYELPQPVITRTGDVLAAGPTGFSSYQWQRNGLAIPGANSSTYKVEQGGTYTVLVTNANGCMNTSNAIPIGALGTGSVAGKNAVRLYPNPTGGLVKVEAPVAVTITVRDATGRVVRVVKEATEVDFGDMADGLYLVNITNTKTGEVILTDKITKVGR